MDDIFGTTLGVGEASHDLTSTDVADDELDEDDAPKPSEVGVQYRSAKISKHRTLMAIIV
jgi:hypothetical protein